MGVKNLAQSIRGNLLGLTNPDKSGNYRVTGENFMGNTFGEPGATYRNDADIMPKLFDHFLGKTLRTVFGTAVGSDGSAVAPTINAQESGVVRLTTGAGAGVTMAVNGSQLHSELNWKAATGGLIFEAQIKTSSLANIVIFVGFSDQVSALEMPFTISTVTLTSNATDAAGFLLDTAATNQALNLVGVANDVDATVQVLTNNLSTTAFTTLRVDLDVSGVATFFVNGVQVGTVMTAAVTPSVALTPYVAAFSRAATSKTVDVDWVLTTREY